MRISKQTWTSVLACALISLGSGKDPALAVDVSNFSGSITDVGVQRGPGQVGGVEFRIRGTFSLDHPLDLTRATVILEDLFVDSAQNGLGELMTTVDDAAVVPLELVARDGDADGNVFDQPQRYRPHIRLQIQDRDGVFEFRLKLDRGLMRLRPRVCEENTSESSLPVTPISHAFVIDDGVNPPVEVATTQLWECTKPGRYHMRSVGSAEPPPVPTRTPTPLPTVGATAGPTRTPGSMPTPTTPAATRTPAPPPGDNQRPTAALKQNVVTGADGRHDVIELDGRDSSDRDGTIVRYRFDSGDGRIQDGPEPIARFTYAAGDYRALLQVFDDRGAASEPTSRGFSVKP